MASSPFKVVKVDTKKFNVLLDDVRVATMYLQSSGEGYRFRLDNYPHRMSALYKSTKVCLKAIEKEVL